MKIVVCVKQVKGEINPFDAAALEYALSLSEAEVTVVSMGPESAKEMLLGLTRLGVKKAILLCDNRFAGSDTLATSYALSIVIEPLKPDLVFCGRQTIDGDTAQVGPCLATMLGFALITNVMEIEEISEQAIACYTRLGEETSNLPALLTFERVRNLRFPSIRSKLGEVEVLSADDIGADFGRIGLNGSPTKVVRSFESNRGKRKCKFIQSSELKGIIAEALKKPTTFIQSENNNRNKLKNVIAIGESVVEIAKTVSDDITVLECDSSENLANGIKKRQPYAVLWPSNLWGRKTAPMVQALLQTGLCADCTHLETDGEILYMYRPASGGRITAKIICNTLPVMATVRTGEKTGDFVVGMGIGAADAMENILPMIEKSRGIPAASRALVDRGLAPYEWQVGLTGKTVAPKVYLALGISGAVQHTCGFESAETVIAVNSDPKADVFDYCDYGVVCRVEDCAF